MYKALDTLGADQHKNVDMSLRCPVLLEFWYEIVNVKDFLLFKFMGLLVNIM
jgi:hypothetical protein